MAVPDPAPLGPDIEEKRPPLALLLIFAWDILRAGLAGLGAIAVFGGSREVRGQVVSVPVAVQIFQALAFGALAAALIVVGTLLTRPARWVRRAQVVLFLMDVVLIAATLTVTLLTDESARSAGVVLVSAAFVLVDLLAVLALTERRIVARFHEPGQVPLYLGALIAFWAAASAAFFALGLLTQ